ncbi:MAG: hypothetical protein ACFFCS_21950 [Candidatus Hodarchaeota archaeon]
MLNESDMTITRGKGTGIKSHPKIDRKVGFLIMALLGFSIMALLSILIIILTLER